jgi:hypothetical protein
MADLDSFSMDLQGCLMESLDSQRNNASNYITWMISKHSSTNKEKYRDGLKHSMQGSARLLVNLLLAAAGDNSRVMIFKALYNSDHIINYYDSQF